MLYVTNSINMVGFVSLIFSYYLLFGFRALIFYSTKIRNNILESLFFIPGVSAEHEDDLRVKLIVESEIGLLLELYRYSSD